jgi:cyclopropane fatty-acyl-phospholipid synthase-like methyltransferase
MKNKWEEFAQQNAEYYILTENIDYKTEAGQNKFYESGYEFTKQNIKKVSQYLHERKRALEIGCGIGRLTLPHSKEFDELVAIDVSPTMLLKLNENAHRKGITNIKTFLPHKDWDKLAYDYVYSYIVFQHIENFEIINDYIIRLSQSLKQGGIANLHFDTRKKDLAYIIKNILPDVILPKPYKRGIRRIRRNSNELIKIFNENNLHIIENINSNSSENIFILRKN